jgi:hypothetical protein
MPSQIIRFVPALCTASLMLMLGGCYTPCHSPTSKQSASNAYPLKAETHFYNEEDLLTLNRKLDWAPRYPDRLIVRTDPQQIAGWYLVFEMPEMPEVPEVPSGKAFTAIFEFHKKGHSRTEAVNFEILEKVTQGQMVMLGLTHPNWQIIKPQIHAWKLTLLDHQGTPFAETQSFAWEMP